MKITIIGAGAAGLCSAIVLRSQQPDADIHILERARADEAPGLGIALLPFSLSMIRMKGFEQYAPQFVPVGRMQEVFAGTAGKPDIVRKTRMQETQYTGVKRAVLIKFLREAVHNARVDIAFGSEITEDSVRAVKETSDLVIGADGAGSVARAAFSKAFSPRVTDAKSRYAWLELEGGLDHFVFGYMYVAGRGLVRITAYPHSPNGGSSAIVTHSAGLTKYFDAPEMVDADGEMSAHAMEDLNRIFAPGMPGKRLVGKSRWRTFHATNCHHAVYENVALIGDAYTTLFYETGWGTSTAIQASTILGHALLNRSLTDGLALYDAKIAELSRGAVIATAKTVREVDGQASTFFKYGPAKFVAMGNA